MIGGSTNDLEEIKQDYRRTPHAGVGIPTGQVNGFFVVEADTNKGHGVDGIKSMRELEERHGKLPPTLMAVSPSGSLHHYFKHPGGELKIKNSSGDLARGVDVRGDGGMVVAPPTERRDGRYRWLNDLEIADAPDWLVELCKSQPRVQSPPAADGAEPVDLEKLTAAIAVIPNNDDVGWAEWCKVGMAIYAAFDGSEAGYQAFLRWSKKYSKFNEAKTEQKWRQIHGSPPDKIGAGTLFFMADQASPIWRDVTPEQHVKIAHLASLTSDSI